jgi:small subunit ribosomal protein S3
MGQKVHPISFRLGITEDWRSRWYARKKQFGGLVVADKRLRDFIKANYAFALIARIDVERTREQVRVTLYCGRPGVIIGRKGSEVDRLRARLEEIVGDKVDINIVEIHHPEMDAQLVAEGIAEQLGKRASFKRTVRKAAETTMDAGVKGVRIRVAGRLGGAEMSRREMISIGSIPLHTLRKRIDYGFAEALTQMGKIGVKVWIHGGPDLSKPEPAQQESAHAANAQTS